MSETKTVMEIIPRNGRDITLPPTPGVDIGLVDPDQAHSHGQDRQCHCQLPRARHGSPLDKAQRQSQSSSGRRMIRGASLLRLIVALLLGVAATALRAQNEPILVPDVVDYPKLLPILPEAPSGWTADKSEGSTSDVGGFEISNVHRDYHKGKGKDAPLVSTNILDSAGNPEYLNATTTTWQ